MGFDSVNRAAQSFAEEQMGEPFTYTAPDGGAITAGLNGVFNKVEFTYTFVDFSTKQVTSVVCISSKAQWQGVIPSERGLINYGGFSYKVDRFDGASSAGEPAYQIVLEKLT